MNNKNDIRVAGFLANGIAAGIKDNGKKDLSVIFSEVPAVASGVFTTNAFKAAPVLLDMERITGGRAQAIIANSGNANAATGEEGYKSAVAMSKAVSESLGIDEDLVFVASTGIIGERLPIEKILGNMDVLVEGLSACGIPSAGEGIMTTDKFSKIEHRGFSIDGKDVNLCGIAKGAGMIRPDMATMLSFIITDAAIEKGCLDSVFRQAVKTSFNAITVDGCMSTNDTVIIMANGVAGNRPLTKSSVELGRFKEALSDVMICLAKSIVKDGEGSTKLIEIDVDEAKTLGDAKKAAYAIASSNLVKTAFFGGDPNWGRIISAVGSTDIRFSADAIELYFDGVPLFIKGEGVDGHKGKLADIMKKDSINVLLKLGMGNKSFRLYTSDLSHEYVEINSFYHS